MEIKMKDINDQLNNSFQAISERGLATRADFDASKAVQKNLFDQHAARINADLEKHSYGFKSLNRNYDNQTQLTN